MVRFSKTVQPFLLFTFYFLLSKPAYAADLGPPPAGATQIQELITRIINLSVGGAFIALTVVLVWAGVKYITSGGEQKSIMNAHQTVTWAFIGVFFLALAWIILRLIQAFTGVNVTQFSINIPGN
jgi:hypothetical protein